MKQIIKRKLKKRLNGRNFTRRFAVKDEWEGCDYWLGLGDDERQERLQQSEQSHKRQKIMTFAKYVDVTDFEHLYLTNQSFRGFVDRIKRKNK